MVVKNFECYDPNISRILREGGTSFVYLLDGNPRRVYKQFKDNHFYKEIMKLHPKYPKYIEYLESLNNSALVIPDTLYMVGEKKKSKLKAYEYDYVDGVQMDGLYPKTNLKKFLMTLEEFLDRILELDDRLVLTDAHKRNILYTGDDIKLIDIDFYHKGSKIDRGLTRLKNFHIINAEILESLLGPEAIFLIEGNPELKREYEYVYNGRDDLVSFLLHYIDYLEDLRKKEVLYTKDLKGFKVM